MIVDSQPPGEDLAAALEAGHGSVTLDPMAHMGPAHGGGSWWSRMGRDLPIVLSAGLQAGDALVILVMGLAAYLLRHSGGTVPPSYVALMCVTAVGVIAHLP